MEEPKQFTYTGVSRDCFCCGETMIEDYPQRPHNPLEANWLGATDWTSIGNWCSSVLDCCMHPKVKRAHIVICDECFKKNEDRVCKIEYTPKEQMLNDEARRRTLADLKKMLKEQDDDKSS
jgi:hypothetical protein